MRTHVFVGGPCCGLELSPAELRAVIVVVVPRDRCPHYPVVMVPGPDLVAAILTGEFRGLRPGEPEGDCVGRIRRAGGDVYPYRLGEDDGTARVELRNNLNHWTWVRGIPWPEPRRGDDDGRVNFTTP